MDRNELINKNVQHFIDIYGIGSNNPIIDGIQKMILHWCGIEQDLNKIPYQSIALFETMSTTECISNDILKRIPNP